MDKFGDRQFDKSEAAPYLVSMNNPLPSHSPAELGRQWRGLCGASGYALESNVLLDATVAQGMAASPLRELSLMAKHLPAHDADTFGHRHLDPVFTLIMNAEGSTSALTRLQRMALDAYGRALDHYMQCLMDNESHQR